MNTIARFTKEKRFPELPYHDIFNTEEAVLKLDTLISEMESLRDRTICTYICLELGVEAFESAFEAFSDEYVESVETRKEKKNWCIPLSTVGVSLDGCVVNHPLT